MKRILLTGGGTAGHVTPNLALIPALEREGFEIHYAGGAFGIERGLAEPLVKKYHAISAGKLRRYFDLKNISDVFRTLKGVLDALAVIRRVKPSVVFSKGGFVSVPVVFAAWLSRVPAVIHESDLTPGLANKLCVPFAKKICATFPETLKFYPNKKTELTGTPIRSELFDGKKEIGAAICGFELTKPTLLVTGGSLGAGALNKRVRDSLPELLEDFNVAHLCGKGNLSPVSAPGYAQFEFAGEELPHLFALCDIVAARAGANTVCELAALAKPSLLVPLPKAAKSRGDQIENAESLEKKGLAAVLLEEDMTSESFVSAIKKIYDARDEYRARLLANSDGSRSGAENIVRVILNAIT